MRQYGAPRWKHAMHLLRLLTACRDLLLTGDLVTDVGADRETLLAVKRGEVPWPQVARRMNSLTAEADAALLQSPLPAEPDLARVEDFLVRTRRTSALLSDPDHKVVQRVEPAGRGRER
jgi:hypothetical protein